MPLGLPAVANPSSSANQPPPQDHYSFKSVTSIQPGLWVIQKGSFAASKATCGRHTTGPKQRQLAFFNGHRITKIWAANISNPYMVWDWHNGLARHVPRESAYKFPQRAMRLLGAKGRMLTTISPAKGPAGVQSILVLYMGTLTASLTLRTSRPSAINASSKEKEQPSKKATRSSRQSAEISLTSLTTRPCSKTL